MNSTLIFLSILFFVQTASAQNNYSNVPVAFKPLPAMYLREFFSDRVDPKPHAGIEGSPFLDDTWLLAKLILADNKIIDTVSIKLNLFQNKVHFKDGNGQELQATIAIKEIRIIDSNSIWRNTYLLSGFSEEKDAFFQLLSDGSKIKLLKRMTINKWEIKTVNAAPQKRFELEEILYFLTNGILSKANKNCASLIGILGNDPNLIRFVAANNIKCNKEQDMKTLVDYFNAL